MRLWICPRCDKRGIQAEGYRYCTKCRNARQNEMRKRKRSERLVPDASGVYVPEGIIRTADESKVRDSLRRIKALLG
jgi:hypothetical protein